MYGKFLGYEEYISNHGESWYRLWICTEENEKTGMKIMMLNLSKEAYNNFTTKGDMRTDDFSLMLGRRVFFTFHKAFLIRMNLCEE